MLILFPAPLNWRCEAAAKVSVVKGYVHFKVNWHFLRRELESTLVPKIVPGDEMEYERRQSQCYQNQLLLNEPSPREDLATWRDKNVLHPDCFYRQDQFHPTPPVVTGVPWFFLPHSLSLFLSLAPSKMRRLAVKWATKTTRFQGCRAGSFTASGLAATVSSPCSLSFFFLFPIQQYLDKTSIHPVDLKASKKCS